MTTPRTSQDRPRHSADRVSEGQMSEATDNSANSYVIEMMERESGDERNSEERVVERKRSSPFASIDVQKVPMPRDSFEQHKQRVSLDRPAQSLQAIEENLPSRSTPELTPSARMNMFKDYRQQIGTRSAMSLDQPPPRSALHPRPTPSNELRISVDMPSNVGTQLGRAPDEVVRARLIKQRRRLPIKWVIGFGIVSSCCLLIGMTTMGIGIFNLSKLRQNRAQKSIQGLEDDLAPIFSNINSSLAGVQLGLNFALNHNLTG